MLNCFIEGIMFYRLSIINIYLQKAKKLTATVNLQLY